MSLGSLIDCPKARNIAVTIDYETWQPIPEGKRIDWQKDIFTPADRLMQVAERVGARLSFMAEVGEYFWAQEYLPEVAARMRQQWQDAARRGHDVQLHLHPSWLPELGARCEAGTWSWDWSLAKAADYPGDLTQLIGKGKLLLEDTIRPIRPEYRTLVFRAGAYQVQPFDRLSEALARNQLIADSSVYAGGVSQERGYDYRLAYSQGQPYFANPFDPQLKAPPAECALVELPIFTFRPGARWFLDGREGRHLARRLRTFLRRRERDEASPKWGHWRRGIAKLLAQPYWVLRKHRRLVNRLLPRSLAYLMTFYRPERLVEHDYFVMIGHTKADLDYAAIEANLLALQEIPGVCFLTVSAMAQAAYAELMHSRRPDPSSEADYQVRREYAAIMGEERNAAQSHWLQAMVPRDRTHLLDLGCGAGYWSARLAELYPPLEILGVDVGVDFIEKARQNYGGPRVRFAVEDFARLSAAEESFDCVYADNTLEHAFDISRTLAEAYRVLTNGGLLLAAIPSDARNPCRICDNHTWKTAPHEVRLRLEAARFVDVTIEELDTYRQMGMAPYPPSLDRMMYVRAWKRR